MLSIDWKRLLGFRLVLHIDLKHAVVCIEVRLIPAQCEQSIRSETLVVFEVKVGYLPVHCATERQVFVNLDSLRCIALKLLKRCVWLLIVYELLLASSL